MAEHMIETRILLRYDTFTNWMNSTTILKQGEAAICSFPTQRTILTSNSAPENTPPAIGIKIGDGQHYFRELPWVQAVAADVYNWAKTSTKPTYTASEISGLKAFIEENISGDGEFSVAPRIYQIVQGTEENINKYYLQYKEHTDEDWVVDTNHYIDLEDLSAIKTWLVPTNLQNFVNLPTLTAYQINQFIQRLTHDESPVVNYFVTSVTEANGVISTTKVQPSFSNLTGSATVAQGGTGLTTVPENHILVGNGTNTLSTRAIATEIAANTDLVPNYLVKNYIDQILEGLTGAMHFIGEASVVINPNTNIDPRITDYDFSKAQPGDVILYNKQEFVWTGGVWRLLGDEGSYAVKGSITDSDIASDANININKIANLTTLLNQKVNIVEGKQLSTNDFDNEYKNKLDNIENGAQRNRIEHIFLNDTEIQPIVVNQLSNSINLQISEFDAQSQQKLNSIETGAQENVIEHIIFDEQTLTPDENKTITIVSNPHTEHENKIESIVINGVEQIPNKNKQVNITIDDAALNLQVIKGARVPNGGLYEDVDITQDKKLELSRIAKTGNIVDILQNTNTYVILDCGSSTEVL